MNSPSSADFDVNVRLAVNDKKTRHYHYLGVRRSAEEKARSPHPTDSGGEWVTRTARVHNGRGNADLTLDEASFELVRCPTQLSTEDFYSFDTNLAKLMEYMREVEKVVKAKTGCDEVAFADHQVRTAAKETSMTRTKVAGYANNFPHTDGCSISGDEQAVKCAGRFRRYLYLNLWRNISEHPIENDHLAMMDERTAVKPDDYVPMDLFMPGSHHVQYLLSLRHADNHRWYYFPAMKKDEGILFKNTDSDWTKPGRTCFHMSAHDDSVPSGHRPRESIELRMYCFWKEAAVDSMPTPRNTLCASPVYSGTPSDYVPRFTALPPAVRTWPEHGQAFIRITLAAHGANDKGIAEITKGLVEDTMGFQGTMLFSSDEKAAIVKALLADEGGYMVTARKHWLALADDASDA